MSNNEKFYINGTWCDPVNSSKFDVIHPGNEEVIASIAMGSEADVNLAVDAAREAFKSWQFSKVEDRVALLERILTVYNSRAEEFVKIMPLEMGTTISFSREVHMPAGIGHIEAAVEALQNHTFERPSTRGLSLIHI